MTKLCTIGIIFCSLGLLAVVPLAGANPEDYPEFAALGHAHDSEVEFIRVEQLVEDILGRKKLMIVDVRSPDEYASEHIKGAISVPLRDFASNLALIPRDDGLIVLY